MPDWLPLALALAGLACVVAAAVCDLRAYEIPDGLSIALVVLALGYGLLTPGFPWLSHLAAPVAVFAFGLLLFSKGWMGGGDVKLLTGIAAWTGLSGLFPFLVGVSLIGGVLALIIIIGRRVTTGRPNTGSNNRPGLRLFAADAPVPYAVAILGGVLWWINVTWPVL